MAKRSSIEGMMLTRARMLEGKGRGPLVIAINIEARWLDELKRNK